MRTLLLSLLLSTAVVPALAETRIASWNIRNLGWDNGKDYAALAEVGSRFDLIAMQEVMSEEGVGRLEAALEARTGTDWDRLCSHLIGRGSYREMYCFTWREDRVSWVEGAVVYTDDRDLFAREPFSAVFIRAPKVVHRIDDGVEVWARLQEQIVAVRYEKLMATSFHPELTGDHRLHRLFVDELAGMSSTLRPAHQ